MYGVVVMAALAASGEAPDFHKHNSGCYGCYGYGCYSAGYGYGYGHGCCSCWGGACYGSYSCAGCYGGACYGSWSCWGCSGCWGTTPYFRMYDGPTMPPADPKKTGGSGQLTPGTDRARLVIEVPADAKLYIDDQLMKTESAKRVFSTPALDPKATYYYILRVEVAREGVTHSESRRILIRAGDEVKEAFTETSIAAASKLPATASR